MTPDQYCQEKTGASGSSFYYSFLFLPLQRRQAITALYAFCREVDDVADECRDAAVAAAKLNWWRGEVERIYEHCPGHPVGKALEPAVERYQLPKKHLLEIIDGMEMDLHHHHYKTFEDLRRYCYHVASVVGLLSARIFGYSDERTLRYAEQLGLAFQLTNILRDVGEDARRQRVYLPLDDMTRFDVSIDDITRARDTDGFRQLMAFEAERARSIYRQALEALPDEDRRAQMPGMIMAAIYRSLLDEIEHDGFPVLHQKVSLTPLRKLWIAWRTARQEKKKTRRLAA